MIVFNRFRSYSMISEILHTVSSKLKVSGHVSRGLLNENDGAGHSVLTKDKSLGSRSNAIR